MPAWIPVAAIGLVSLLIAIITVFVQRRLESLGRARPERFLHAIPDVSRANHIAEMWPPSSPAQPAWPPSPALPTLPSGVPEDSALTKSMLAALEAHSRNTFWSNIWVAVAINFVTNLLFFGAGIGVTMLTTQHR